MRTQICKSIFSAAAVMAIAAFQANAQEPANGGWRKFGEAPQNSPQTTASAAAPEPYPVSVPGELVVPAGTWITVRVNQPLSSDVNQQGDAFTATLAQPIVANGLVVARRGQTVAGRVAEAAKAGRIKGTSRLGLELTELGIATGRQIPLQTRLIERTGNTSTGTDAVAIGTTTGIGAAIGAAADGGFGAGMGAIAGAAASTIGVLVTRGRSTEVYPETPLTFRLEAPLRIPTEGGNGAFVPVSQNDYEDSSRQHFATRYDHRYPARRPVVPVIYGRPGPWGPWGYPRYYAPFYYGPSLLFYSGPRYYPGFYRGW